MKDSDFESEFSSKYYIRLLVKDVAGVLAKITTIYGDNDVSINSVIQKDAEGNGDVPVIFVTHLTKESSLQNALKDISKCENVTAVAALIRVEE